MTANRTRLGLESLEARANPTIIAAPHPTEPGVYTFISDSETASEYLQVRDTGLGGSNISYRLSPMATTFTTVAGEYWKIVIDTKGGDDTVRHQMQNSLTHGLYREVDAKLGAGLDNFQSVVRGNISGPDNRYGLHVIADGGGDRDIMTGIMQGDIVAAGDLAFSFTGGHGWDDLTVNLQQDVDIASGARFWANMYASDGNDNVYLYYRGEMDGKLLFVMEGGNDPDFMRASLTLDAGSTGIVGDTSIPYYASNRLSGGNGTDTFEVGVSGTANNIALAVYGEADTDTFTVFDSRIVKDRVKGESLNGMT